MINIITAYAGGVCKIMDLAEFFFANYAGGYRFPTEMQRELTQEAIEHIKQMAQGITEKDKQDLLMDLFQRTAEQGYISIRTIPYEMYEARGTIIHKNVFYYHPVLQMIPHKPVFDDITMSVVSERKRYLEIKRLFTIDQLFDYIYKKTNTNTGLCDKNRDIGALKYLATKYENIKSDCNNVTFLDFVLILTDTAAAKHEKVSSSLLTLFDNVEDAMNTIKQIVSYAKLYDCDHEIFRDESVYKKYGQ